jgi:hypothetical protein
MVFKILSYQGLNIRFFAFLSKTVHWKHICETWEKALHLKFEHYFECLIYGKLLPLVSDFLKFKKDEITIV